MGVGEGERGREGKAWRWMVGVEGGEAQRVDVEGEEEGKGTLAWRSVGVAKGVEGRCGGDVDGRR